MDRFLPDRVTQLLIALLLWIAPSACTTTNDLRAAEDATKIYELRYSIDLTGGKPSAKAAIQTGNNARLLRELSFAIDADRHSNFSADGELTIADGRVTWAPPRSGGALRYDVRIDDQRQSGSFDARMTDDWAIFRGGDVFPPARSRTVAGAESAAILELKLPDGWSAVTPYLSGDGDFEYEIVNPTRAFDRPTGWIVTGDIGVRRGRIAGVRVAIAGPTGQGLRRMDIMAFLRWTLPAVVETFPSMDERLVIVGANDPMWRGGLSGPGSMFVHADRPLISENGTSTFLHELVHVAMGAAGSRHDDWLLEGLAEYYSMKILASTGTLSNRRTELTLQDLAEWGESVDDLFVGSSRGPVTARAVTLLAELDGYLAEQSAGEIGLDEVVIAMIDAGGVYDYSSLCEATAIVTGNKVPVLEPSQVPGAPSVPECQI